MVGKEEVYYEGEKLGGRNRILSKKWYQPEFNSEGRDGNK